MKSFLMLIFLFTNQILYSNEFKECNDSLNQQAIENNLFHLSKASIFISFKDWRHVQNEMIQLAEDNNLGMCLKRSFHITGRTLEYSLLGEICDIENFQSVLHDTFLR